MGIARLLIVPGLALAVPAGALAAPPPAMPANMLLATEFNVSDLTKSLHFYVDGLGMKVTATIGAPQRRETMLGFGDPTQTGLILLTDSTATQQAPIAHAHGYDRVVVRLADLEATAARLRAAGFTPSPIREVMGGYHMMMVTDPDGYQLELVQPGPQR